MSDAVAQSAPVGEAPPPVVRDRFVSVPLSEREHGQLARLAAMLDAQAGAVLRSLSFNGARLLVESEVRDHSPLLEQVAASVAASGYGLHVEGDEPRFELTEAGELARLELDDDEGHRIARVVLSTLRATSVGDCRGPAELALLADTTRERALGVLEVLKGDGRVEHCRLHGGVPRWVATGATRVELAHEAAELSAEGDGEREA